MKTFVIIFIVLIAFCTDASLGGRFRSMSGNSAQQNVSACLSDCQDKFEESMNEVFPNHGDDNTVVTFVNTSRTQTYCRIYGEAKTCVGKCADDDAIQFVENHKVHQYVCLQSNFTTHAPCYSDVLNATRKECTSTVKCGPFMQSPAQQDSTARLKRQCNKWKCGLDCMKQAVVAKCGQPAFGTLKTATIKAARTARSTSNLPTNVAECDKLRNA